MQHRSNGPFTICRIIGVEERETTGAARCAEAGVDGGVMVIQISSSKLLFVHFSGPHLVVCPDGSTALRSVFLVFRSTLCAVCPYVLIFTWNAILSPYVLNVVHISCMNFLLCPSLTHISFTYLSFPHNSHFLLSLLSLSKNSNTKHHPNQQQPPPPKSTTTMSENPKLSLKKKAVVAARALLAGTAATTTVDASGSSAATTEPTRVGAGKGFFTRPTGDDSSPRHPHSRGISASVRRDRSTRDVRRRLDMLVHDEGDGSGDMPYVDEEDEHDDDHTEDSLECEERSHASQWRAPKDSRGQFVRGEGSSRSTQVRRKRAAQMTSWRVTGPVPGGPSDITLIPSIGGHVALRIWNGDDHRDVLKCQNREREWRMHCRNGFGS